MTETVHCDWKHDARMLLSIIKNLCYFIKYSIAVLATYNSVELCSK